MNIRFKLLQKRSFEACVYENMKRFVKMSAAAVMVMVFCGSFFGRYHPVSLDLEKPLLVEAEIKGEVANPGVYQIKNGADIQELIDQAGGLNEKGDISTLSLMAPVEQGQVVVIPEKKGAGQAQLISINTASVEELDQLPGIGPAMAKRIVDYRNEHSFSSLEQIMEVKGIKEKLFSKIRDYICL